MQFYQIHDGGFGGARASLAVGPHAAIASLASEASPFGLQALAAAAGLSSSDWAVPAPAAADLLPADFASPAAATLLDDDATRPAHGSARPAADSTKPADDSARPAADSAPPPTPATSQPPDALVAAIVHKAATIAQDNSPEDASGKSREIIERQMSILEEERDRLAPIASREHWIALVFAVLSGSVLLGTISLVVFASTGQALITLVSSVLPGFLSTVFFSRETKVEGRIAAIASDLRQSERARDRLAMLEQLLRIVPSDSHSKVVASFTGIII